MKKKLKAILIFLTIAPAVLVILISFGSSDPWAMLGIWIGLPIIFAILAPLWIMYLCFWSSLEWALKVSQRNLKIKILAPVLKSESLLSIISVLVGVLSWILAILYLNDSEVDKNNTSANFYHFGLFCAGLGLWLALVVRAFYQHRTELMPNYKPKAKTKFISSQNFKKINKKWMTVALFFSVLFLWIYWVHTNEYQHGRCVRDYIAKSTLIGNSMSLQSAENNCKYKFPSNYYFTWSAY